MSEVPVAAYGKFLSQFQQDLMDENAALRQRIRDLEREKERLREQIKWMESQIPPQSPKASLGEKDGE